MKSQSKQILKQVGLSMLLTTAIQFMPTISIAKDIGGGGTGGGNKPEAIFKTAVVKLAYELNNYPRRYRRPI